MRRYLVSVSVAVCLALGVALPASAEQLGPDSELVDRYTQLVYELERPSGSPVMKIEETVVNAKGWRGG